MPPMSDSEAGRSRTDKNKKGSSAEVDGEGMAPKVTPVKLSFPKRTRSAVAAAAAAAEVIATTTTATESRTRASPTGGKFFASASDTEVDIGDVLEVSRPKVPRMKFGKGVGHYVGLSKAKQELKEAAEDSESSTSTDEQEENEHDVKDELSNEILIKTAERNSIELQKAAAKLGTSKGKEMKGMTASLIGITKKLAERCSNDEVRRLHADNKRLRGQLDALQQEVAALRRAYSERGATNKEAPTSIETDSVPTGAVTLEALSQIMEGFQRELTAKVGSIVSAHLEGLEVDGRLLPAIEHRPPLAADKMYVAPNAVPRKNGVPTILTPPAILPKLAREKRPKTRQANQEAVQSSLNAVESVPTVSDITGSDGSWTQVVKKNKKNNWTAPKPAAAAVTKQVIRKETLKTPGPKKAPKTPAIVLTLSPDEIAGGNTYAHAIKKIKSTVSLRELGIGPAVFRTTITGARLIELPKETPPELADKLAAQIKAALGDSAKVARPTKMAELRIQDLDDSISTEELKAALAQKSGCSPDKVSVGNVYTGRRGLGAAMATLPVAAANQLVAVGRIIIGWSVASIQAVEARPMRCFKCMGMGHPVQRCPAKDRTGLCYRCGMEGHKAKECSAPPKCAVCADAKVAADHRMGGQNCNPPPMKGRVQRVEKRAPAASEVCNMEQ